MVWSAPLKVIVEPVAIWVIVSPLDSCHGPAQVTVALVRFMIWEAALPQLLMVSPPVPKVIVEPVKVNVTPRLMFSFETAIPVTVIPLPLELKISRPLALVILMLRVPVKVISLSLVSRVTVVLVAPCLYIERVVIVP